MHDFSRLFDHTTNAVDLEQTAHLSAFEGFPDSAIWSWGRFMLLFNLKNRLRRASCGQKHKTGGNHVRCKDN